MELREPEGQNSIEERTVKSYRDTIVSRGAHAHLGDVSQDLNISGGLHLHFPTRLESVVKAGSVIQFLDFEHKFSKIAKTLEDPEASVTRHKEDIHRVRQLLGRLPMIISQLNLTARSFSNYTESAPEKALQEIISSVNDNARQIHYILKDLKLDPETETYLAREEFLDFWKFESSKFVSHETYRDELNKRLADLLNVDPRTPLHSPNQDQLLYTKEHTDDIVEVLSFNHLIPAGLQNAGAIFTQRDGQVIALTAPRSYARSATNIEGPDRLIRYNLDSTSTEQRRESMSEKFLIEKVPDFTRLISQTLYFREESNRRTEVREAHRQTFGWILDEKNGVSQSEFVNWLKYGDQCFWISGKAGSGKSTLMKYIHDHQSLHKLLRVWAGSRRVMIGSFFFWHAGQPLQKSYEGILRALLHQVLEIHPGLTPVIFPRLSRFLLLRQTSSASFNISVSELQDAIRLLATAMPKDLALFLVIDGVDEYFGSTADHFEFCKFLTQIAQNRFVKILVSSRPTPACHQVFSRFPSIRLQDLTAGDISAYIDEELVKDELFQNMSSLEEGFQQRVVGALIEKSSGVFLWIVLVVRRLLIGLGNYDSSEELMVKIGELPSDLEELYDYMFQKMTTEYRHDGSFLLQLICQSKIVQIHSLTALQLFQVSQQNNGFDLLAQNFSRKPHQENLQIKAIEGKLRSRCCGLVEVVHSSTSTTVAEPHVDFIHLTVYDYVRNTTVWERLRNFCSETTEAFLTILLASCVYKLKQMGRSPNENAREDIIAVFSSCLSYSYELNSIGISSYIPYLDAANATFTQRFERFPAEVPVHWTAFQSFVSYRRLELPEIDPVLKRDFGIKIAALHVVARTGLPEYFQRMLLSVKMDRGHQSRILVDLLNSIMEIPESSDFVQLYGQNIKSLLQNAADPNEIASPKVKSWRHHVPWDCCLFSRQATPIYFEICLEMVRAGAELRSAQEVKRRALERWYHWIWATRHTSQDPQILKLTTELLNETAEGMKWVSMEHNHDSGCVIDLPVSLEHDHDCGCVIDLSVD